MGMICDLYWYKDVIGSYPEAELVLVYDEEMQYGSSNFLLATTVEAAANATKVSCS